MPHSRFGPIVFIVLFFAIIGCKPEPESQTAKNPKLDKLKVLPDFKAEHLYSPSENNQGSWVAMAFDDKGRLITSDQYGALYRLTLPAFGSNEKTKIEKLAVQHAGSPADTTKQITMGFAQGLLYAFNSLYVMVNTYGSDDFDKKSGLYRLQDTDSDDQFDKITQLKALNGAGEHGPHSVVLSPDKKSLYVIAGNHTDLPEFDSYRLPKVWQEDNMFPLIKDPRGHANDRYAPGGWIAQVDSTGANWELVGAGFRNAFDIAFNQSGDLFTYDSDMEWDLGMPWYRPTRICHVTSGSEFGWRTGNSKWSADYPDNLPPVINIGQGSPTNLVYGANTRFPNRYRNSLFAFDWSFGIIYAVTLKPVGSSYSAEAEEFLSGVPLPLTDGVIGPDGALYFLTGGRRLESDLYRVYYSGKDYNPNSEPAANEMPETVIRRKLEAFHNGPSAEALNVAWSYLNHEDRFVRYAARVAVEHQPVSQWQQKALAEKDPVASAQAMIALAHHGNKNLREKMFSQLTQIDFNKMNQAQQVDVLRAIEVILLRMGVPNSPVKTSLIEYLSPHYPAKTNRLNRSLSTVLVYLNAPQAIEKTLTLLETAQDDPSEKTASASSDLILRNPQYGMDIAGLLSNMPPAQQIHYAIVLSEAETGWTPNQHEKYFNWFKKAFTYKGGNSYVGFINKARQSALKYVPKDRVAYFDKLSGGELLSSSGNDLVANIPDPKGPWRNWDMEDAKPLIDQDLGKRNFEQGKNMFAVGRCLSCHAMRGEGGSIGPDLTQLGTRFSKKDMLEAIIEPDKTISDQYAATVFTMNDATTIVGRITDETQTTYMISQNPFAPQVTREIPKANVKSRHNSTMSVMYPGLINPMNEDELKDLLAYLMAGGNPNHTIYATPE
jgi:putative heme-binding domain-containing protein